MSSLDIVVTNVASAIVAIVLFLAALAAIFEALFGVPLISILRPWFVRLTRRVHSSTAYLPEGPGSSGILKGVIEHLAKNENQKALDEANRILGQLGYANDESFITDKVKLSDPLLICNAFALKGEALVLLGKGEGLQVLVKSIQVLNNVVPNNPSADQQKEHILGRAFNDVAYFYRIHKNYPKAEQDFWRALPHLQRSKNQNAKAHTLKNLAYTYALQGKIIAAEILCQDAIEIFENLRDDSGKAFGINTLGLICIESKRHEIGEIQCKVALEIFKALKDKRGIGLASIGLAYSLRRLSSTDLNPKRDPISSLQTAKKYLNESIEIFAKISEPERLVEAYSELGCVYRDWARLERRKAKQITNKIQELEKSALSNLEMSLAKAKE